MIFERRKSMFFRCPFLEGECLAAGCAAWRWFDGPNPEPITIDHEKPLAKVKPDVRPKGIPKNFKFYGADDDGCAFWSEPEESAVARRRGYCGACGKPEVYE